MKLTLEQATDLAYWAEIVASHAKNYQGMLTFSAHPDIFHKGMVNRLRKPLENLLKSLPVELLAEINGNAQAEPIEPLRGVAGSKPTPRDFVVFNDVASVLGHAEAEKQLQLVIGTGGICFNADHLNAAFPWASTPQRWNYWFNVSAEIKKLKE